MWQGSTGAWQRLTVKGALSLATTYIQEKQLPTGQNTRQNYKCQTAAQQLTELKLYYQNNAIALLEIMLSTLLM